MKNINYIGLLFFGLLVSCTTNDDDFTIENGNVKSIIIEAAKLKSPLDSRTNLSFDDNFDNSSFSWRNGDTLGIFPDLGGYQVAFPLVGLSDDTPASYAEFDGGGWALVTDAQYSAYYPFGYNNRDFKSIPVSYIGQKQVGENTNHIGTYDYMWASSELQQNGKLKFSFKHLGSLIYFKVNVPEGVSELDLTSIEIVSSDDETFVRKGYFNLNDETPCIIATESSAKLSLDVNDVTLKANQTSFLYVWTAPTDLRNKDITIKVYGKDKWYKMSKTISREYLPETHYGINVNALTLGGNIVDEQVNGVYEINTLAELKWFANQVNSGTNDFNGKTVRLMNDIDLNNEIWTPIGQLTEDGGIGNSFKGTFDGNGFTIKNLSVTVEDGAAGLFGTVQNCIEIKNLKIENANIESNHYAGALVGFLQENGNYHGSTYYTVKVTDCEVNNVTVKVTPNQVNGSYDNGDKAGGLIGYAASDIDITNCKVNNANITGYRDLGGLVGHSNTNSYGNVTINNCDVRNTVITQDLTNGYKDPTPSTLGAIYGRGTTDGTGNTQINVTIVCPGAVAVVDGVCYGTLSDALEASSNTSEPIVIESDIELSEQLVVSNSTTIDLNGKVISVSDNSSTYSSRAGEETGFTGDALLVVKRGTTLTIKDSGNGGRIDTGENSALMGAIKMTELGEDANGDKASLIVEGGTIKGYYYGIMGNGNRHDTSIEIKGGTIEAYCEDDNTGIFHPQNGTLTISGGTIKGYNAAVEMRAGTLKISGGAFFSTATPLTVEGNGSGTTTAGAAIAVSQHSTNLDLKVEITGGEFNGYYALNEIDVQDNTTSNISMSVKGGTFNGSIASENCTEFITNGTFSNPSACSYLGENANVTVNMTESYEGPGFSTKSGQTVSLTMAENVVYNATNPLVGSTGTVSQSFQFLQGSTVTIEGGQLTSSVARMFIQNYANLTLEGVEVAPEIPNKLTSTYYYVLSNNCGTVNLNNGTKIIAPASSGVNVFAMDVCKYTTYPSVTVNVNSGASIQGNVEYSGKLDADNGEDTNQKLYVKNGATIKGNLIVPEGCQDARWKGVILESGATIEGNGWVESGATVESLNTVNM